jgi:hypothetical protein
MDNVQKRNICATAQSSETFRYCYNYFPYVPMLLFLSSIIYSQLETNTNATRYILHNGHNSKIILIFLKKILFKRQFLNYWHSCMLQMCVDHPTQSKPNKNYIYIYMDKCFLVHVFTFSDDPTHYMPKYSMLPLIFVCWKRIQRISVNTFAFIF